MYLTGHKSLPADFYYGEGTLWSGKQKLKGEPPTMDGFHIDKYVLNMGYWRKHPDLHGYIVKEFANGVDDCKEIPLTESDVTEILEAVRNNKLPNTSGFFFGSSGNINSADEEERAYALEVKQDTIDILEKAKAWLEKEAKQGDNYSYLIYQASW